MYWQWYGQLFHIETHDTYERGSIDHEQRMQNHYKIENNSN